MKAENSILNQLKKAQLPAVPNGFFVNFSNDLWQLIELEDDTEGLLNELVLNRFENVLKNEKEIDFKESNLKIVKLVKKPEKRSNTKQVLLWVGAVAASLALFFAWPVGTNATNELASEETPQEVLLAYLDEDDLVDYLVDANSDYEEEVLAEEDILFEEIEDEIYNYINDI
ncbi:MAG: hypothetical protein AB8B72_05195 [Crocinitomicaceae bacterium]